VFAGGRDLVSDVWVAGRHLLVEGRFTRLDWPALAAVSTRGRHPHPHRRPPSRRLAHERIHMNVDAAELAKFSGLAGRWWDPKGPSRPLHELNPVRLQYIERAAPLAGRGAPVRVVDVGCGGGILSEAMARAGARVLGIDLARAVWTWRSCTPCNPA